MHSSFKELETAQGTMFFLGSISHAVEQLAGRGANGITFRAGRNIATKQNIDRHDENLLVAIESVKQEMEKMGMKWDVEVYKKKVEPSALVETEHEYHVKLVFRNCMVRSCQFHYGHPQKNSLCMLNHGLFCGLLQKIHGSFSEYDFIHSGENACIGLLRVKKGRAA
ncbi:MAG: hypothetical protein GF398_14630 [Chitinivibrionales bacterium]|nr:hypothetical protein [Chitinivibrionales bacterium]